MGAEYARPCRQRVPPCRPCITQMVRHVPNGGPDRQRAHVRWHGVAPPAARLSKVRSSMTDWPAPAGREHARACTLKHGHRFRARARAWQAGAVGPWGGGGSHVHTHPWNPCAYMHAYMCAYKSVLVPRVCDYGTHTCLTHLLPAQESMSMRAFSSRAPTPCSCAPVLPVIIITPCACALQGRQPRGL